MLSSLKNRRKGNPFFLHRKPITPYFFHFQSAKGDWLLTKRKKEKVCQNARLQSSRLMLLATPLHAAPLRPNSIDDRHIKPRSLIT